MNKITGDWRNCSVYIIKTAILKNIDRDDLNFSMKAISLFLASILVLSSAVGSVKSAIDVSRAREISKCKTNIKLNRAGGSSDIVIICVGKENTRRIKSKDIQTITTLHFEHGIRQKSMHLVSLRKNTFVKKGKKKKYTSLVNTWSTKKPENMLQAIKYATGMNTNAYMVINTKTIYDMVGLEGVISINLKSSELKKLNEKQRELKEYYRLRDKVEDVTYPGVQPLNPLQAMAYTQITEDEIEGNPVSVKRTRKIIRAVLRGLRNCSRGDLESARNILMRGDNNFKSGFSIKIAAIIQSYTMKQGAKWPHDSKWDKWKGERYLFLKSVKKDALYLHQSVFENESFICSKELEAFDKKNEKVLKEIARIKKEKAEEKKREEEERRRLEEAAREASEDNDKKKKRKAEDKNEQNNTTEDKSDAKPAKKPNSDSRKSSGNGSPESKPSGGGSSGGDSSDSGSSGDKSSDSGSSGGGSSGSEVPDGGSSEGDSPGGEVPDSGSSGGGSSGGESSDSGSSGSESSDSGSTGAGTSDSNSVDSSSSESESTNQ